MYIEQDKNNKDTVPVGQQDHSSFSGAISKKTRKVLLVIAALFFLGAIAFTLIQKPFSGSNTQSITLGVESSILSAPVWIAEEKGFFKDFGLDVTIKEFDSRKTSFLDMLNGGVDFSIVASTPIMFQSFKREDFSILATLSHSDNDAKIVVRKDSGVQNASDLKGKKIGLSFGTTEHFFIYEYLSRNSINPSDLHIVDTLSSELSEKLKNGAVDAIVVLEPHAHSALQLLKNKGKIMPGANLHRETFNLVAIDKFIEDNSHIAEKLLSSIVAANEYIKEKEDESMTIVSERLGLNKDLMNVLWDDFVFEVSLNVELGVLLEDKAMWAIKNNLVDSDTVPDYVNYVYSRPLQRVDPSVVSFDSDQFESITVAEGSQPVFAVIYVAEEKGFFKEEGLSVSYKKFTSGRDALNSVIRGEADIATVYETPIVINSHDGHKLSIISGLHSSDRNTALLARKDLGISQIQDLKGRKIGVTRNSNGEFFLNLLLEDNGLSIEDITLVDIKPQDMKDSLQTGLVDAVATWNTHLFSIQRSFSKDQLVVFFSDKYTELSVLAGMENFVLGNKEKVSSFLRALIKAEKFMNDNYRESQEITIKWLSDKSGSTIRAIWEDSYRSLALSNRLLDILKKESKWFRDSGAVTGPEPDFSRIIFEDYLKEIDPVLVSVD